MRAVRQQRAARLHTSLAYVANKERDAGIWAWSIDRVRRGVQRYRQETRYNEGRSRYAVAFVNVHTILVWVT